MTDDQQEALPPFDAELQQLVEKYRAKDKTFDWTAASWAVSALARPEPSLDVVQRTKQDFPVVTVPTAEEQAQRRLERYKNAVAFGLYSEWPTCKQQEGIERLYQVWNQASEMERATFEATTERIKQKTLKRVLPE